MSQISYKALLPEDYYARIGMIVSQFGIIENLVDRIIWAYLGLQFSEGRAITSEMSITPRLNLLIKLAGMKINDDQIYKALKDIRTSIKNAFDDRNVIVHGLWYQDTDSGDVFVSSLKKKTKEADSVKTYQYSLNTLKDFSILLGGMIDVLDDLRTKTENVLGRERIV